MNNLLFTIRRQNIPQEPNENLKKHFKKPDRQNARELMGKMLHSKVDASVGNKSVESVLFVKTCLLILAICVCTCAISGCTESIWDLASDSRLPKWIALQPGLTRADVIVVEQATEPTRRGVGIKVILYNRKHKKLEEIRGKSFNLSGRYFVDVVHDVPEIIGLKTQKNEHGDEWPYFFVVDDPALKRKLLDENEKKLRDDIGSNYTALRKKLLDENDGPTF